jgi:hypothetical protein
MYREWHIIHIRGGGETLEEGGHLEDIGIDGMII